uniref:Uncharacterized protein n=1 Tax=Rhizophora mucronata TaxID=61149 RepID=A0A2P2PL13_RHIMU
MLISCISFEEPLNVHFPLSQRLMAMKSSVIVLTLSKLKVDVMVYCSFSCKCHRCESTEHKKHYKPLIHPNNSYRRCKNESDKIHSSESRYRD